MADRTAEDVIERAAAQVMADRTAACVRLFARIRDRLTARGVPPTDPLWKAAHNAWDRSHEVMVRLQSIANGASRATGTTLGPVDTFDLDR
jgi:hypothetical protein